MHPGVFGTITRVVAQEPAPPGVRIMKTAFRCLQRSVRPLPLVHSITCALTARPHWRGTRVDPMHQHCWSHGNIRDTSIAIGTGTTRQPQPAPPTLAHWCERLPTLTADLCACCCCRTSLWRRRPWLGGTETARVHRRGPTVPGEAQARGPRQISSARLASFLSPSSIFWL